MKSTPVYFFVQRNSGTFASTTGFITFDDYLINTGQAMKKNTGVFTAPVAGTYHFVFTGLVKMTGSGKFWVSIMKNNAEKGRSATLQSSTDTNGVVYQTVALQATLNLNAGATVALKLGFNLWNKFCQCRPLRR